MYVVSPNQRIGSDPIPAHSDISPPVVAIMTI